MPEYVVAEVLATEPHRVWNSDNGPIHYFKVDIGQGIVAEAGKKKPDTPPEVGDRYKNLKPVVSKAPEGALPTLTGPITDYQGDGKGGKSFEADPKRLRGENYGKALEIAGALCEKVDPEDGPALSSTNIIALANKFYDAIEAKAKVGE